MSEDDPPSDSDRDAPSPTGPPPHHIDRPASALRPEELPAWTFEPIGIVRSPYRYVHDAPRQGVAGGREPAVIELRQGMQNCLEDLAGFDRLWVLFAFSYARGWNEQVRPPRSTRKHGVFATRAPHRPNPIGLSCVRILEVRGRRVTVTEHDLLDGSPVLDLKPYVPYCDAFPSAAAGWVESADDGGPDHRWE